MMDSMTMIDNTPDLYTGTDMFPSDDHLDIDASTYITKDSGIDTLSISEQSIDLMKKPKER